MCRIYWNYFLVHYVAFGVVGPLVGVFCVYLGRRFFKDCYWIKALGIFALLSLGSYEFSVQSNLVCQNALFGSIDTSPGDVGVVLITAPVLAICFFAGLVSLYVIRKEYVPSK